MIPQIIHQTWKDRHAPAPLKRLQASWRRLNPGCQYRFYDDRDCLEFVRECFPNLLDTYQRFQSGIQKADFFRYLVVYQHGGLYADMDMECYKPFDRFFDLDGALFCIETQMTGVRQKELGYKYPYQIANCIFAAEPGHGFLKKVIDRVVSLSTQGIEMEDDIEEMTGPRMLTRLYYELLCQGEEKSTSIFSQIYWMPPTTYPKCWPLSVNMYARHHFYGSWKRPAGKLSLRRRWIQRSKLPNLWPRSFFQSVVESTSHPTAA